MYKVSQKKKYRIFFETAVCLLAAFFFLTTAKAPPDKSGLQSLNKDWYYEQDGKRKTVTLPSVVQTGTESLTLCLDSLPYDTSGMVLTLRAAKYDIEVYAGERLLYRYDDHGQKRNETVLNNVVCLAPLPDEMQGNPLRIVNHSPSGKYKLPVVLVGHWNETLLFICRQSIYTLFITLTLLVLGLLSIVLAVILRRRENENKKLFHIGLFLVCCGFWCLTDSPLVQFLSAYSNKVVYLNFYAFMLMPVPMLHFISETGKIRYSRVLNFFLNLYCINIAVQTALAFTGTFTFFQMLWVTHGFILAGIVIGLRLLVLESRRSPGGDVTITLYAVAAAAILGAVSIILYAFANYGAYQALFQTGILLFVIILLSIVAEELFDNMRYRTEAEVYRRMAEEDKLTNLQNRRAFDLRMQSIEMGMAHCENAALVFMDINGLKRTNDCYGHSAGDRLVIAAARCIEAAFGQFGYCYRIGGDEFCAVLPNPRYREEELLQKLQTQVEKDNARPETKYPLSIASGCSFLKAADGTVQSVSDWKTKADQKMYESKKATYERMKNSRDDFNLRGGSPR